MEDTGNHPSSHQQPRTMDDAELENTYDAHAAGLFRYLISFTKCEADARDLLQDLFIKLARGEKGQALTETARLYRIAHNLAVDWLRRRAARGEAHERLSQESDSNPQCSGNPDSGVLAYSFARALESLPDEQRAVVELKLFDGLTFEEIAEVQGVPLNTAASKGMAITPPQKRGASTRSTGSTAIISMTLICSPAFIKPISAVSEVPARPAKSKAVTTGPNSRTRLSATSRPRASEEP